MENKSKLVMYLLWAFLGFFGAHRFYLGDTKKAVLMICFGWATLFIWPVVDVFFLNKAFNEKAGE